MKNDIKYLGFWHNDIGSSSPMPIPDVEDWEGGVNFRAVLTAIQLRMQNSQKEAKPLGMVFDYKEMSHCRLCDCADNSRVFVLGGFAWPSLYLHYLGDAHFVRPDPEFQQFVKDWAKENMTLNGEPIII